MGNLAVAQPIRGIIVSLFRIDIRTLALFRILLSTLVLVDLSIRIGDLQAMYSDQGVIPVELVKSHFSQTWRWSLFWLNGSIYFQTLMFAMTALFAVAVAMGFHTRIATICSWILLTSLYNRVPFAVSGADTLLVILFFWAMFLPLDRCWSVDAWRQKKFSTPDGTVFSGATFAILIQVFLLYFCTGCYKAIYHTSPGMLLQNTLEWADYNRPVGNWLLSFPNVLQYLSWSTICFEILAPWLLFSPYKTSRLRLWTLLGLILLHIGIELTLSVALFSYVAAAGFCLFLPPEFWDAHCWNPMRSLFRRPVRNRKQHVSVKKRDSWHRGFSLCFNSLCVMLIIYVMVLSAFGFFQRTKGLARPNLMNRVNELTMLNQRWSMFASLQRRQTRLIAEARLDNGQQIDILRLEKHFSGSSAPVQHPNHRWVKYFQALSRRTTPQIFKDRYARWLFKNWNDSHSEGEQIQELSLKRVRQMLPDDKNLSHVGTETLASIRNDKIPLEETIQWNGPWRNP